MFAIRRDGIFVAHSGFITVVRMFSIWCRKKNRKRKSMCKWLSITLIKSKVRFLLIIRIDIKQLYTRTSGTKTFFYLMVDCRNRWSASLGCVHSVGCVHSEDIFLFGFLNLSTTFVSSSMNYSLSMSFIRYLLFFCFTSNIFYSQIRKWSVWAELTFKIFVYLISFNDSSFCIFL